jgi:D-alanyl-D-alanine carboxypeptidase
MKHKIKKEYLILIALIALLIISGAIIGYFGYQNYQLKKHGLALENELLITTKNLNNTIDSLSKELSETKTERDDFEQKYNLEKNRMDSLASQITELGGAVGDLEKLNETDPELLQKYSKVYFLNENYIPETLVKISSQYTFNPEKDYLFYLKILPFLQDLMSAAASSNIDIKVISAYRSFGTQSELKSNYKMVYGSGSNQFSADQGYSEHQLGTTVDFTTPEIGVAFSGFEKTEAYQWLLGNAYKYGFILSYPENNSYYQFEPWHWRFVGRSLADKLRQDERNFYDLDQREIDQYLLFFFD